MGSQRLPLQIVDLAFRFESRQALRIGQEQDFRAKDARALRKKTFAQFSAEER